MERNNRKSNGPRTHNACEIHEGWAPCTLGGGCVADQRTRTKVKNKGQGDKESEKEEGRKRSRAQKGGGEREGKRNGWEVEKGEKEI